MRSRRRGLTMSASVLAAVLALFAMPAVASAGPVQDLLKNLGLGGGQSDGGGAPAPAPAPAGGVPGSGDGYQPPLHGTNPHGQGTIGVVDLLPEEEAPLSDDPAGGSGSGEDVVLGRPRGEQNPDGSYKGHITILSLLGAELLGVDTADGETAAGPLDPIQTALLDEICTASGGALCLNVLTADSSTDGSGSTNHFQVLGANVGVEGFSISASVAESNGNIGDDGSCQTAEGDSSVASANVLDALTADALQSSTTSVACNDGTSSQTNDSEVVNLSGTGIPVPATGCDDGTPNVVFDALSPLLATVCNADDTNTDQTELPYGVREALDGFVLLLGDTALAKATTGAAESHARAPDTTGPPDGEDGGRGEDGEDGEDGGGGGGPAGEEGTPEDTVEDTDVPAAASATPADDGTLPFTGSNLFVIALLGAGLLGAGLLARSGARVN